MNRTPAGETVTSSVLATAHQNGHSVCFCRFDVADTNSVGFRVRTRRF